jgi:hypothetical protein
MAAKEPEHNEGHRDIDAVTSSALLVKEMEEINNWARLAFQMYFGWFALQFTVNAVAMGWLFTSEGPKPPFARLVFLILAGWNLMGTITTLIIRKQILDRDSRITEVINILSQNHLSVGPGSKSLSPMPRQAIKIVFAFCALTTGMSLAFWTALEIWPQIIIASPPGSP